MDTSKYSPAAAALTAADWQPFNTTPPTPCFRALIRYGDRSADVNSAFEFVVGGGIGQYAWGLDAQQHLNSGWVPVILHVDEGGGPDNVSLTLDITTVNGPAKTFTSIWRVIVEASADPVPVNDPQPWAVEWQHLIATFYDSNGVGTPSNEGEVSTPLLVKSEADRAHPVADDAGQGDRSSGAASDLSLFATSIRKYVLSPRQLSDPNNPLPASVRVQVTGMIRLTAPATQPTAPNQLIGRIYVYAEDCV